MRFTTFVVCVALALVCGWSAWPWGARAWVVFCASAAALLYTNRLWHWECSHHGCNICQDLSTHTSHCSWCVNTLCDGQPLDRCQCSCHTFKYLPQVAPNPSNTRCTAADLPAGPKGKAALAACGCSGHKCVKGTCARVAGTGVHCSCSAACSGEGPLYNFKKAFLLHAEADAWTNRPAELDGEEVFDVVYAGGGLVNLMAAYHLLLNSRSQVRILLIDPRSKARDNKANDFKVGESTLSPTSTFLFQELGLHDWMIEHCPIKHSLSWHWAKDPSGRDNSRQTDYYTIEETIPTQVPTYQLNRARLEAHLISLIEAKGGRYVRAFASLEQVGEGGQLHSIRYRKVNDDIANTDTEDAEEAKAAHVDEGAGSSSSSPPASASPQGRRSQSIRVHARHLVDGSGRKFLLSTRLKLLHNKPEDVFGLDNASVWIRVANADYSRFTLHGDSGFLVGRPIWVSSFYNTNHYMGPGYWIWVIPIETTGAREVSIGVTFHRQVYEASQFNTQAKLLNFLQANHGHLYDVCTGPQSEILDFHFLPKLAHWSAQTVNAKDNWLIMGEAAYNADPFYSTGLVFASHQCMQATTLLLGKLGGVDAHLMERHASAYNEFQAELIQTLIFQIHDHPKHMGNAAVMSWRLYTEAAWLSHPVAAWFGRWFLCPAFCVGACKGLRGARWCVSGQHDLYTLMDRENANIGWMDMAIPNLINLFGFDWFKRASGLRLWHADGMMFEQQSEFQKTNVFKAKSDTFFFQFAIMTTMVKRAFGWRGFVRPDVAAIYWPRALACLAVSIVDRAFGIAFAYRQYTTRAPVSNFRALQAHQFKRLYDPKRAKQANPW